MIGDAKADIHITCSKPSTTIVKRSGVDFRNIKTQKDIEYLFIKTNFTDGDTSFEGLYVDAPEKDVDEEVNQYIGISECSHMGSLMSEDWENRGGRCFICANLGTNVCIRKTKSCMR